MRYARSVPQARAEVAISALKSAMMHVGSLRQARTSFIYVGSDFSLGTDSIISTSELINAANDANVAFFNIGPDGLQFRGMNRSGILGDLAANTGGDSSSLNAPSIAFRRIVEQARGSYLLGYSPEPQRYDGKFHKIKVGVKKSGIDVRARHGYWAPDVAAMTRARAASAEGALAPEVASAFKELLRLDRPETSAAGLVVRTIITPDPPSPTLQIGVPRLWRVQHPSDLAMVLGDAPPPPFSGRAFARTDRLLIRFGLDGPSASNAVVTVGLLDRHGKRLTDLPFTAERGQPSNWLIDFPLTSIARGDYALFIGGSQGDLRTSAYIPIRVLAF